MTTRSQHIRSRGVQRQKLCQDAAKGAIGRRYPEEFFAWRVIRRRHESGADLIDEKQSSLAWIRYDDLFNEDDSCELIIPQFLRRGGRGTPRGIGDGWTVGQSMCRTGDKSASGRQICEEYSRDLYMRWLLSRGDGGGGAGAPRKDAIVLHKHALQEPACDESARGGDEADVMRMKQALGLMMVQQERPIEGRHLDYGSTAGAVDREQRSVPALEPPRYEGGGGTRSVKMTRPGRVRFSSAAHGEKGAPHTIFVRKDVEGYPRTPRYPRGRKDNLRMISQRTNPSCLQPIPAESCLAERSGMKFANPAAVMRPAGRSVGRLCSSVRYATPVGEGGRRSEQRKFTLMDDVHAWPAHRDAKCVSSSGMTGNELMGTSVRSYHTYGVMNRCEKKAAHAGERWFFDSVKVMSEEFFRG